MLPLQGFHGVVLVAGRRFVAAVEAPTKKQAKKKAALMAITNLARWATESQSQEVSPRSAGTEESWQMLEDYEMVEAAIGGEVALLSFNLQYFLNRMNGAGNLRFRNNSGLFRFEEGGWVGEGTSQGG